ncbi:hypothetical protein L7F22_033255 [Adiantum nelumboides]|nr:hypothetical protein [Adiantum nelumboides]
MMMMMNAIPQLLQVMASKRKLSTFEKEPSPKRARVSHDHDTSTSGEAAEGITLIIAHQAALADSQVKRDYSYVDKSTTSMDKSNRSGMFIIPIEVQGFWNFCNLLFLLSKLGHRHRDQSLLGLMHNANSMETPMRLAEFMETPRPISIAQEQVAETPASQTLPVQPATLQQPNVGSNGQASSI